MNDNMHRNTILHNIHYKLFLLKPRIYNVPVYLVAVFLVCVAVKYLRSGSPVNYVPIHLRQYLQFEEKHILIKEHSEIEIEKLKKKVAKLNMNPEIVNWRKFGVLESETTVLVVQVHRDVERLQYLVVSLAQAQGIHEVVVVFSHSFYDTSINKLIRSITFCRVMQIFYPYSVQLNPSNFPGHDPTDCNKQERASVDAMCERRNATLVEHKQHWWWMANIVFYQLSWSQAHRGFVVFLAEDDYVVPDMLHMLQFAQRSLTYLPDVEVIALGRPYASNFDYDLLNVDVWAPPFDRGLAVNKSFWRQVEEFSSYFCMYTDSSWSYSLMNLFRNIGRGPVDMVACEAPRVMSTSMFSSGKKAVETIWERLRRAELFPKRVKASLVYNSAGRAGSGVQWPPHGDGEWSDVRDHLLCLDPLLSTTTEATELDITTTPPLFTSSKPAVYTT